MFASGIKYSMYVSILVRLSGADNIRKKEIKTKKNKLDKRET